MPIATPLPVASCGDPRDTLHFVGSRSPSRPRLAETLSKVSQNAAEARPHPGPPGIADPAPPITIVPAFPFGAPPTDEPPVDTPPAEVPVPVPVPVVALHPPLALEVRELLPPAPVEGFSPSPGESELEESPQPMPRAAKSAQPSAKAVREIMLCLTLKA